MSAPETIDRAVAIARGDAPAGQYWANLSDKDRDTAELGIRRVLAAGYRILGPDDVGAVTVDDVAAELWKAEAEDAGAPASIANGRTRDAFDDQSDELKRRWRKFARAAVRAIGRKA